MRCSYTISLLRFCSYIKGRYTWNEIDKTNFFLAETANFSASDGVVPKDES